MGDRVAHWAFQKFLRPVPRQQVIMTFRGRLLDIFPDTIAHCSPMAIATQIAARFNAKSARQSGTAKRSHRS